MQEFPYTAEMTVTTYGVSYLRHVQEFCRWAPEGRHRCLGTECRWLDAHRPGRLFQDLQIYNHLCNHVFTHATTHL